MRLAPLPCANGLLAGAQPMERPWHITLMHGRRAVMGAPPDIVAFHVGIVVRDLHAVMDRYQRMFALEHWHLREPQPGLPMRIAYGGREGTGLAFELIGPPTDQSLRQWLQDDYDRIIPPAPWAGQ